MITITERGYRENTALGRVLQIKIFEEHYRALSWREVWEAFAKAYPNRWAVQCFPPTSELVDGKAVYHLFVCDEPPRGLSIK